jgi:glycosidase
MEATHNIVSTVSLFPALTLLGVLNYPLYWGILHGFTDFKDAIDSPSMPRKPIKPGKFLNLDPERKRNFNDMEAQRLAVKKYFKDHTSVGNFLDNHDRRRFLNLTKEVATFKHALVFTVFTEGIPIIYYGSEQAFRWGGDPGSRQAMFNNFDPKHEMYTFIKNIVGYRKTFKVRAP